MNKLDVNHYTFVHLTLILLLVKCTNHSLAVYNNEFIMNDIRG